MLLTGLVKSDEYPICIMLKGERENAVGVNISVEHAEVFGKQLLQLVDLLRTPRSKVESEDEQSG
jgi:hypothetical protein